MKEKIINLIRQSKSLLKLVQYEIENLELDNFALKRKISDLYYVSFWLTETLLLTKNITNMKRHITIIFQFNKNFDFYNPIGKLFNLRNKADYDSFYETSEEEVEQLIKEVKEFYNKTLEYLRKERIFNEKEIEELKL